MTTKSETTSPKVLALSSGGGHWVQLLRLRPAFDGCIVHYATVKKGYQTDVGDAPFHVIPDSNRWNKFALLRTAFWVLALLVRLRPDVVISTGAAPGFFAVRLAKLLRMRTIWVDSIANGEELSLSGQKAGFCDLWVTQWEHLATAGGPKFFGNVLGDPVEAQVPVQESLSAS